MIRKILRNLLGDEFTENNEKYAKINFLIIIVMFIISAIMLFSCPINCQLFMKGLKPIIFQASLAFGCFRLLL